MQNMMNDPHAGADLEARDADHVRVKRMFEEFRDQTEDARRDREADEWYYHTKGQWTAKELAEFQKRGQPVVTYNVIKIKVEAICGVEEKTDTDPQAWPRNPQDEDASQVATKTLRYVCDSTRFDKTRVDVLRNVLIVGTGGAIVEVKQKGGPNQAQLMGTTALTPSQPRFEVKVRRLRWETIVYDPYSREEDFSDARYLGVAQWMDEADVLGTYGERAREAVEAALTDPGLSRGNYGDSLSDRPNYTWADVKRRRVLVVELYHREGDRWHHCVFTGGGLILSAPSAYVDEDGVPTCPIELVSAFVNPDNERYGVVYDMRSPQDEVNHRRAWLLHRLSTRQTWRKEGAIASKDPQHLRKELNKAKGDVQLAKNAKWGEDVGIIENSLQVQGQAELLQDAMAFLDRQGPNAGLMGRGTEDQSGRAILAQQQAGLAELATIFAGHNDWVLRIYRQIWARSRQYWTAPMWIRVTDDLGAPEFIQINEVAGYDVQRDAYGNPVIDWQTGQPVMQPVFKNRIAEMGVDLIVDRVPHTANLQAEEFQTLAELAKSGVVPIPPQAIIMASTLRNKRQILDFIEKAQEMQQPPPPDPIQQEGAMAEIENTRAKTAETLAKTKKLEVETVQAVTQPSLPRPVQTVPRIPLH